MSAESPHPGRPELRLVATDSSNPALTTQHGKAMARNGQWEEASHCYRRALGMTRKAATHARLHALIAQARFMCNDMEEAQRYARMTLDSILMDTPNFKEGKLAELILWEAEWRSRHPGPNTFSCFWHALESWLRGYPIHKVGKLP